MRANATAIADYYYPLQLKFALTLVEPIHWKGGFYRDLIKFGQANPTQCSSSRSILVSSQVGKASRRCLRSRLLPYLATEAGETQFGGLPGRGTTHASLVLRVSQSLAKLRKLSFGALFLDVVQAFYRAIRELVVRAHRETDLDDLTVATIVRAAGLPPAAMQQLADRLRQRAAALSRSDVDPHTVAQVEQCCQAP